LTDRTYHITIEGYLTTNMTAKDIKENAYAGVWSWSLEKQKVTVKRIVEKKPRRRQDNE